MSPSAKVKILVIPHNDRPYTVLINKANWLEEVSRILGAQTTAVVLADHVMVLADEDAPMKVGRTKNVPATIIADSLFNEQVAFFYGTIAFAGFRKTLINGEEDIEAMEIPGMILERLKRTGVFHIEERPNGRP